MEVRLGDGKTKYGTGVQIDLSGSELQIAIDAYLVAHNVHVSGARTIRVNGAFCHTCGIYVDPSGHVNVNGETIKGNTGATK